MVRKPSTGTRATPPGAKVSRPVRVAPAALGVRKDPAVDAFIHALEPARRREVEAVRKMILGVSPDVREGIKWNAPSFCTREWFATFNLREKSGSRPELWLILHAGATAKGKVVKVDDPDGLLTWLGKDRALVTFRDEKDVHAKSDALTRVVRDWIADL